MFVQSASETLGNDKLRQLIESEYPIQLEPIQRGNASVTVHFEADRGKTAKPVFGCFIFR